MKKAEWRARARGATKISNPREDKGGANPRRSHPHTRKSPYGIYASILIGISLKTGEDEEGGVAGGEHRGRLGSHQPAGGEGGSQSPALTPTNPKESIERSIRNADTGVILGGQACSCCILTTGEDEEGGVAGGEHRG
jgi:hypothetical protein